MIASQWSSMIQTEQISQHDKCRISRNLYEQFCKYYLFDAIRGLTFGQAFCQKFFVSDNLLLYTIKNENEARQYIRNAGYIEAKVH